MPSHTSSGYPYVDPADALTDYPATMQELAELLEARYPLLWDSTEAGVVFPAASIATPPLPQTFKHLRIIGRLRGDAAGAPSAWMRFNADAAGHYDYNVIDAQGTGATPLVQQAVNAAQGVIGGAGTVPPAAIATSYLAFSLTVMDYAAAAFHEWGGIHRSRWGALGSSAHSGGVSAGEWTQAAAISALSFLLSAGNIAAGRISVYGEV